MTTTEREWKRQRDHALSTCQLWREAFERACRECERAIVTSENWEASYLKCYEQFVMLERLLNASMGRERELRAMLAEAHEMIEVLRQ